MPYEPVPLLVQIKANGSDLSPEAHAGLVDLRVRRSVGVPSHARLAFRASTAGDGIDASGINIGIGHALEIVVADRTPYSIFKGSVVGLGIELDTGTSQHVIVEGYDPLYKLGRTTMTKSYVNQSARDAISSLASECGLAIGSLDSSLGTFRLSDFAYQYSTAYAFIDRLVREAGCEWFVEDDKLQIRPRSTATTTCALNVGQNLLSFSARYSASEHVDEVKVTGWDVLNKKRIEGLAKAKGGGRKSEIGLTGTSIATTGVGGKIALTIPRPVRDVKDAQVLAKSVVERREGEMLRARGEALPDPNLKPGAVLSIKGLGANWEGDYYCTSVEHTLSRQSLRTSFEVGPSEPDSLVDLVGQGGGTTLQHLVGSFTVGIVTNNQDPEKLNRVKLKLPYLAEDLETGWARVLQPGSGSSRGWNTLPEVGDEVLVGFEHGHLDHPLVLGGLVNGVDKPKYTHADTLKAGKVEARVFNSRLGHELRFADGGGTNTQFVQMNTVGKESTLLLGAEMLEVHADGVPVKVYNERGSIEITKDGDITLKGANITLKSTQDITIDAGANVNIKSKASTAVTAQAKLDLKANAPATLQSSAITAVKGSIVQIN